ncbi:MAG: hypothetical protein ABSF90_17070 [Syntrophobacteraceae bacterium]|jgi:hypothetical protein
MTTTQLFVELLIIGIGAAIWFGLLLAAIFGYRFDVGILKIDTSLLVVLGSMAYVLGIAVDRLARTLFRFAEEVLAKGRLANPEEIERLILVSSEALARQIQYNRSRLRICRAWAFNILLALPVFVAWNLRVGAMRLVFCWLVVGIGFLICALMAGTAWVLSADHDKNLRDSDKFLEGYKSEGKSS